MSQQAAALLTQKAGNDNASILTPRVILQPHPVLNVDVPVMWIRALVHLSYRQMVHLPGVGH
jgi:hypothetical protein